MNNQEVKHLLSWKNWEDAEIKEILLLAQKVKNQPEQYQDEMKQKTLVMLFQKTSTRTRVSFEAGMTEMGGHAIFLDWQTSNFGLTKIEYETGYLSRNAALIMARMKKHEDMIALEKEPPYRLLMAAVIGIIPVKQWLICSRYWRIGDQLKGAKLTYIGVHNNVVNSLMSVSAALGAHLTLVCPIAKESSIDQEIKKKIREKGLLTETLDKEEAVKSADYVYTDTWIDMEFFDDPAFAHEKKARIDLMLPYQVNKSLITNPNTKIMHDMPIHPGYEISEEMVYDKNSIIFSQAENRMHAQKAIILKLCK